MLELNSEHAPIGSGLGVKCINRFAQFDVAGVALMCMSVLQFDSKSQITLRRRLQVTVQNCNITMNHVLL